LLLQEGSFAEAKTAFEQAVGYGDADDMAKECDYRHADALLQEGRVKEAYLLFKAVSGYKDAQDRLAADPALAAEGQRLAEVASKFSVNSTVTFGAYDQDGVPENGNEPIVWRILAVQDGYALLISEYALECHPFHSWTPYPVWEKADLRAWLLNAFLPAAFSAEEQALMAGTRTPATGFSEPQEEGDRIFLLSAEEAAAFFPNNADRRCTPTASALAHGATIYQGSASEFLVAGEGAASWWLRTSGTEDSFYASYVYMDGSVCNYGSAGAGCAVRPALWLDILGFEEQ